MSYRAIHLRMPGKAMARRGEWSALLNDKTLIKAYLHG
jgi:hypothetical protein